MTDPILTIVQLVIKGIVNTFVLRFSILMYSLFDFNVDLTKKVNIIQEKNGQ